MWLSSGRSTTFEVAWVEHHHLSPTHSRAPTGLKPQLERTPRCRVGIRHPQDDVVDVVSRSESQDLHEPEAPRPSEAVRSTPSAAGVDLEPVGQPLQGGGQRSRTRSTTRSSAPGSRGPSAANSVSLPRRASTPTSVNSSVRSTMCMPRWAQRGPRGVSRSATHSATTWRSLAPAEAFTPRFPNPRRTCARHPSGARCATLRSPPTGVEAHRDASPRMCSRSDPARPPPRVRGRVPGRVQAGARQPGRPPGRRPDRGVPLRPLALPREPPGASRCPSRAGSRPPRGA